MRGGPSSHPEAASVQDERHPLASLAVLFLKLGSIGFGGGMAVIALMERELVQRRRLVEPDEFLHGVALGQLLGPFAVNAAFFVGYRRHGLRGALLASLSFLFPSVSLVILLSFLYFRFHSLPALASVLAGLGPVVIALILSAAFSAGRRVLATWPAWLLAIAGLAASLAKINPAFTLLAAGGAGLLLGPHSLLEPTKPRAPRSSGPAPDPPEGGGLPPVLGLVPLVAGASTQVSALGLVPLVLTFFKVGLVFFGGGFVLVAILSRYFVHDLGWLSPAEFLDGVAISNLTPGPIAVLATFVGYKLAGAPGALLATAALLTPALVLMTVLCAGYERFRNSDRFADFMSGVSPAVVGLIASAAVLLWAPAIPSWRALLLAAASLGLLLRFRWHPAFVLALGAALAAFGAIP
jgi:chromate transporter